MPALCGSARARFAWTFVYCTRSAGIAECGVRFVEPEAGSGLELNLSMCTSNTDPGPGVAGRAWSIFQGPFGEQEHVQQSYPQLLQGLGLGLV